LPFILLESSPKFIFPEKKHVLAPYNKYIVKIIVPLYVLKVKKII
jgi:hypothetical protein